jgi:NCAIR mutase (PurE)-related protein
VASFRDLGFARVDTDREARQGAPEGIVAEGKTPEEVAGIATALLDSGAGSVMVTRADEAARAAPTPRSTSARGWRGWRGRCPRCAVP